MSWGVSWGLSCPYIDQWKIIVRHLKKIIGFVSGGIKSGKQNLYFMVVQFIKL